MGKLCFERFFDCAQTKFPITKPFNCIGPKSTLVSLLKILSGVSTPTFNGVKVKNVLLEYMSKQHFRGKFSTYRPHLKATNLT